MILEVKTKLRVLNAKIKAVYILEQTWVLLKKLSMPDYTIHLNFPQTKQQHNSAKAKILENHQNTYIQPS